MIWFIMLGLFALHGTLEVLGGPTGFQTLSVHSAVLQVNTCGMEKLLLTIKWKVAVINWAAGLLQWRPDSRHNIKESFNKTFSMITCVTLYCFIQFALKNVFHYKRNVFLLRGRLDVAVWRKNITMLHDDILEGVALLGQCKNWWRAHLVLCDINIITYTKFKLVSKLIN